jgi:hypothetical protein
VSSKFEWLDALLSAAQRETAVEAAYYAVRALKQSSFASLSRKDHLVDAEQSAATPEAQQLATLIVGTIEHREGASLETLAQPLVHNYVEALFDAVQRINAKRMTIDSARGEELLGKLRKG